MLAGHEGGLLGEAQVVEVGPVGAADSEDVAEAPGGDEGRLCPLALGEGVDDDGGAVHEVLDGLGPEIGFADGVEDALGEVGRGRGGLGGADTARLLIEVDEIGEGSAYVRCQFQGATSVRGRWIPLFSPGTWGC